MGKPWLLVGSQRLQSPSAIESNYVRVLTLTWVHVAHSVVHGRSSLSYSSFRVEACGGLGSESLVPRSVWGGQPSFGLARLCSVGLSVDVGGSS